MFFAMCALVLYAINTIGFMKESSKAERAWDNCTAYLIKKNMRETRDEVARKLVCHNFVVHGKMSLR